MLFLCRRSNPWQEEGQYLATLLGSRSPRDRLLDRPPTVVEGRLGTKIRYSGRPVFGQPAVVLKIDRSSQ